MRTMGFIPQVIPTYRHPASNIFVFLSTQVLTQNAGIGTTAPLTRLHVGDSAVLFSAARDIPTTSDNVPQSKMMN